MLEGFVVDFFGTLENMDHDWKELQGMFPHLLNIEHKNKGRHRPPSWRDIDFDWSLLFPQYGRDFALCDEWQMS